MPDPTPAPTKIWGYLFVVTFSAIIVALGANELQHRFAKRGSGATDVKKLVRDLKGDPEEIRASFSRKAAKLETKATNEELSGDDRQELKQILDRIAP